MLLASSAGANPNMVQMLPFNGGNIDAFSRQRVSNPYTMFESKPTYQYDSMYWSYSITGAGSAITVTPWAAAITLTAGTGSTAYAMNTTRTYWNYQPGKSQLAFLTGNFQGGLDGAEKSIGMFDDRNGLMFRLSGTAMSVLIRSDTSGSVTENIVYQSAWNLDRLDGTGPSKYNADWTKSQILIMDFEWLGVGRVRFGVWADDKPVYCHQFINTNVRQGVYMAKPNLPVRYELKKTAVTASSPILTQICATIISEGGRDNSGTQFGAGIGSAGKAVSGGTTVPLVSLRLKADAVRGPHFQPFSANVSAETTSGAIWGLCYNCEVSGGTWVGVTNSAVEYNLGGTAITLTNAAAVNCYQTSFASANSASEFVPAPWMFGSYDISQTVPEVWTLWVTDIGGNDTYYGNINWFEYK